MTDKENNHTNKTNIRFKNHLPPIITTNNNYKVILKIKWTSILESSAKLQKPLRHTFLLSV